MNIDLEKAEMEFTMAKINLQLEREKQCQKDNFDKIFKQDIIKGIVELPTNLIKTNLNRCYNKLLESDNKGMAEGNVAIFKKDNKFVVIVRHDICKKEITLDELKQLLES